MIKLLYGTLAFVLLAVASVYIFIPDQIVISKVEQVESSDRIISEYLRDQNKREQWLPANTSSVRNRDSKNLDRRGYEYEFKHGSLSSANVSISKDDLETNSVITWEPVAKSTFKVTWRTAFQASKNPVKRFMQYLEARQLKQHMSLILLNFLTFIVDSKNIYGFDIQRLTVKDTILATSTMVSTTYPETGKIYNLINEVKAYAVKKGSKPVNVPMLNLSKDSKGAYNTMVALPINKNIENSSKILVNHMVAGNILVTEIKGGPGKVAEGFNQMKHYINDFKLISPAMPFESLVTDRSKEPDTTKWITKIYYPIF